MLAIDLNDTHCTLFNLYLEQNLTIVKARNKAKREIKKVIMPILQTWVDNVIKKEGYGFRKYVEINVIHHPDRWYRDFYFTLEGIHDDININSLRLTVLEVEKHCAFLDYNSEFQEILKSALFNLIEPERQKVSEARRAEYCY